MATADLSSLLTASKGLTSHLSRPDLPSVKLSLDQIEALSRRLVSRQPGSSADAEKANYLLAQAHVDVSSLSQSIAHLNPATTFSPLQPLLDTDVAGYLRVAHEQNLISTIEESRKETQEGFYRTLEERSQRDWETKKKRVFEELGGKSPSIGSVVAGERSGSMDLRASTLGRSVLGSSVNGSNISLAMQSKMMAYDRVITDLNSARLRGISYPVVHALIDASIQTTSDPRQTQTTQLFHILSKITVEPPSLPPIEHAGAHILNTPLFSRKFARAYLADPTSQQATLLRAQIASGARKALEEQYYDVLLRTVSAHAGEARLGGDPSISNKVRAFLAVRYYRGGEWEGGVEIVAGQPIWAKLFYLVRTGYVEEAVREAERMSGAIEGREPGFVGIFRTWLESIERRLPKAQRDHLQAVYNAHMLHSSTVDPFKLALYKLMGKIDPNRRSVAQVTTTTEDWLWFQLAMVDEDDPVTSLRTLADVLLGYGERHFDGSPGQANSKRGVWASVLLMCGEFERAVAALWDHPETEIEAVHLAIALAYHGLLRVPSRSETSDMSPLSLSPASPPALSLPTLIWRYIRQFVKMDSKEALQYIYTLTLSSDAPGPIGKEQVDAAWDLTRRVVVLADSGPGWEELVGGFRVDGTRFAGVIEQNASLLALTDKESYSREILERSAKHSLENDRVTEAIKLYNLAGDYSTVVSCLAVALGQAIAAEQGGARDGKTHELERTASDILRHYERTGRAVGREREAVVRLLKIREAVQAKERGKWDLALDLMESTGLIPLSGDITKITRQAEEFRELHESLQRNLQTYLVLTMDALAGICQRTKSAGVADATRQLTLNTIRKKSRSLMIFGGILKYRMSPDIYSYLARLDVEIAL